MTWYEFVTRLYEDDVFEITLDQARKWVPTGTISGLNDLQQKLQLQIPGLLTHRTSAGDVLVVRLPNVAAKIPIDCIENPGQRYVDVLESDVPYFESLLTVNPEDVPVVLNQSAEPGKCHCNVRRWVQANVGYYPVPGWLISHPDPLQRHFTCHSVTERPGDGLIDVSPYLGRNLAFRQGLMFVRHRGSPEEFRTLRDRYNEVTLTLL